MPSSSPITSTTLSSTFHCSQTRKPSPSPFPAPIPAARSLSPRSTTHRRAQPNIITAERASITPKTSAARRQSQPAHIIKLILEHRTARSHAEHNPSARPAYNRLTTLLQEQINAHKNAQWDSFIASLGPRPSSTRPFWRKINQMRNGAKSKNNSGKLTKPDGTSAKSDEEKAALFTNMLEKTFRGSTAHFDEPHRQKVEHELQEVIESPSVGHLPQ